MALTLSDPFCVDRHRAEFLELIRASVDILFANEAEIASLYRPLVRRGGQARAGRYQARRPHPLGEGQRDPERRQVVAIPAAPVSKVVDTTGAGDLYAAGFLFGIATGRDLETAGRLGSLAAAEIISHIGARPEGKLQDLARKAGLLD